MKYVPIFLGHSVRKRAFYAPSACAYNLHFYISWNNTLYDTREIKLFLTRDIEGLVFIGSWRNLTLVRKYLIALVS